jgi:hypothetical protein
MDPRIEVQRRDLSRTRLVPDPDAPAARTLRAGEVRLRVRRFALSANNVTYAAFGETMHYWRFFPCADDAWGCVPVWGFADVAESFADGVAVGERLYGYLPMGSWLVVQPQQIGRSGFIDGAAHRAELPAIYNRLERCAADQRADSEGVQALLRPLFSTAFLIDDFLAEAGNFGARQLLLSSASSKTAWCTAFCRSLRPADPGLPAVLGLTSARNAGFVDSLGVYDRVLEYAAVEQLDCLAPTVYIDFAGDASLRKRIHSHWADQLRHSAAVGGTHWLALGGGQGLSGPRPTLFFAPAQAARRAAAPPAGWGGAVLAQRIGQSWSALMERLADPAAAWLRFEEGKGLMAASAAWADLIAGGSDPRAGLVFEV